MATKPGRMGGAIWLYKRLFRHRILRFLLLQRRQLRLHWPRSLLAVDTHCSWTQRPRSARLIRFFAPQHRSSSGPVHCHHPANLTHTPKRANRRSTLEYEPIRLEASPRHGRGLAVCPLQRFVRRLAGPRRPHLLGFITWTYRPYRPESSLLRWACMHMLWEQSCQRLLDRNAFRLSDWHPAYSGFELSIQESYGVYYSLPYGH